MCRVCNSAESTSNAQKYFRQNTRKPTTDRRRPSGATVPGTAEWLITIIEGDDDDDDGSYGCARARTNAGERLSKERFEINYPVPGERVGFFFRKTKILGPLKYSRTCARQCSTKSGGGGKEKGRTHRNCDELSDVVCT